MVTLFEPQAELYFSKIFFPSKVWLLTYVINQNPSKPFHSVLDEKRYNMYILDQS